MSNNIDLKTLWGKQETAIPDTKELFEKTKKFRNRSLRKIMFANILLLCTSGFIGWVWYAYQPEMLTTKIGIVITIISILIYLFVYNKMVPLLKNVEIENNSSQYLKQLLIIKAKHRYMETTLLNMYFILLAVGISMYMIEYVSRMTIGWGLLTYAITLGWIAFNWFFIRPMTLKNQQKAIDDLINKFKNLDNQFNDEDGRGELLKNN